MTQVDQAHDFGGKDLVKVKLEVRPRLLPQSEVQGLPTPDVPPLPPIRRQASGIGTHLHAPLASSSRQPPRRGRLTSTPTLTQANTNKAASVADSVGTGRGSGAGVAGLGSPVSERQHTSSTTNRKRNASLAGFDSSPGTIESPEADGSEDGNQEDRRKQPVKRACNECRQQKLRCNVVQEPFQRCTRCERLHLDCKIESNFKRVGKRSRNAEMEREIADLKRQLAQQSTNARSKGTATANNLYTGAGAYASTVPVDQWNGSHEAVAGLLDLRSGVDSSTGYVRSPSGQLAMSKRIEDVIVSNERVTELFQRFFALFHPFCPFLNPERTPDHYMSTSPLLFWVILSIGARHYETEPTLFSSLAAPVVRLLWSTIAEVPQNYHVVKALALLCTWSFPTSSTTTDPTFTLCGIMMQIALQIGLHRPSHAQDFSKFKIELRDADLKDRVRTWAVCNIVAQRVATAYGQPANTLYDWTLASKPDADESFRLPSAILNPLLIEQFNDKVSKTLYTNRHDPVGLGADHERATYVSFLSQDFEDLQEKLRSDTSPITNLYLRAACLHLRISAFFSPSSEPSYQSDLFRLYKAITSFLNACLELNMPTTMSASAMLTPNSNVGSQNITMVSATIYLFQTMLAAGFGLLKLNYSFLGQHGLDTESAKVLFRKTIFALRGMSVAENDLAERLAEVLAQVWLSGRVRAEPNEDNIGIGDFDDSLRLKVRCRMSMSLVYDAVWRWRQNFQLKGKSLEAYLKNPTDPAATMNNSSSSSITAGDTRNTNPTTEASLAPSATMMPGMASMTNGTSYNNFGTGYGEANYEVFDPLNWMLDGLVDFPYSFTAMQGLDQQGVGFDDNMNHQ